MTKRWFQQQLLWLNTHKSAVNSSRQTFLAALEMDQTHFNWYKYIFYFNYSKFTRSYELFSQELKHSDCVMSGNKRKIAWRRKCKLKIKLKWCTQSDHPSSADFLLGLGVNFHILLSLWCILFRIGLSLFKENLNLKKHLHPKHRGSRQSRFGTGSYTKAITVTLKIAT